MFAQQSDVIELYRLCKDLTGKVREMAEVIGVQMESMRVMNNTISALNKRVAELENKHLEG